MSDTKLHDKALRRTRAVMFLNKRLRGQSKASIAQEFNVNARTVERELLFAKRMGLLQQYEDQILEELVPAAMETFKRAMQNGDTAVAMEVFKGMGFLLRPQEKQPTTTSSDDDESLEVYWKRTKLKGGASASSQFKPRPAVAAIGPADVVEGSVLENPDERPADTPAPVGADGDESRAQDSEGDVDASADDAGLQPEHTPPA